MNSNLCLQLHAQTHKHREVLHSFLDQRYDLFSYQIQVKRHSFKHVINHKFLKRKRERDKKKTRKNNSNQFESSALIAAYQLRHKNLFNGNRDEQQQKQTNKQIDRTPQIFRHTYFGYDTN